MNFSIQNNGASIVLLNGKILKDCFKKHIVALEVAKNFLNSSKFSYTSYKQ